MTVNKEARWQVLKYSKPGDEPLYRCERNRGDMNIIDSKEYHDLKSACLRRDDLNSLLERATRSVDKENIKTALPDLTPQNFWAVMETLIEGEQRYLCYRLGDKSGDGRARAEFDGQMFSDRKVASARCRELNAPLLPEVSESQYMYGERIFYE